MRVVYIGEDYFSYQENTMLKACGGILSAAHHLLQQNIITALSNKIDLSVITFLPIGSFPKFSNIMMVKPKEYRDHSECGYINVPLIKEWSKKIELKKKLIDEAEKNENLVYVIIYDSYVPLLNAAIEAKIIKNNIRIINIIPDLPGEKCIDYKMYGKLAGILQRRRGRQFYKNIKKADGAIVLTNYMVDELKINHMPNIVMECVVDIDSNDFEDNFPNCEERVILYAGEINSVVNIDILLKAFNLIRDNDVRLWIFGGGDAEYLVRKYMKIDGRIKFFGFIPPAQLNEYKKKASVFINPRQNSGEYTKYSFPSKNAEYLKTGKPLIAYKLDGIPQEYYDYMFSPADNTVVSLKNVICETLAIDNKERNVISERQIAFMKKKTAEKQAERIIELLGEIQ